MPDANLQFSPFTGNSFVRTPGVSLAQAGGLPPVKAVSPGVNAWLKAEDVDASADGAKMTSPYSQSAWVYIAISRMAEKISSIPFRISRMDVAEARKVRSLRGTTDPRARAWVRKQMGETLVESGAAVDLFECPHPNMNRQLFWEMVVTWNCLRGEFFILPLDGADMPVDLAAGAPRVDRLITLPTELFWHIVQGYELNAWRYTGSPLLTPIPSEILLPSEVIHSRTPNPYLFWRGMSPFVVAMVAAGADFAASKYNQGYWLNNADTGVIVTTEQQATPEQRVAILAALRERKRKAGTADRPLFLWGGAKVEKPQLSGMEANFIENRKMNRQEIGAIFKVPDSVMGFADAKASGLSGGGAAIDAEQLQWVESTIIPLCCHLEAAVAPVVKTFGEGFVGWFDVDSLPVMQKARQARLDSAIKAFGIGATFNEVTRIYDLGLEEKPWGDNSYLPFSLQQVGGEPELPGEDDEPEETPEEKANPFARMGKLLRVAQASQPAGSLGIPAQGVRAPDTKLLWQSHVKTRRKQVALMQSKVEKVLYQFRTSTLAKLAEVHLEKSADRGSMTRSLVDLIFSGSEFGKKLNAELQNPILSTLQTAGNELRKELGFDDPWVMPPAKAQSYLTERTQNIMDCGQTVRDRINTALNEGLDAGETTKELAARVKGAFNDLSEYEAERVARTETNMAYNDARHDAMKSAGIEYKAWLSSHGPHVREAHALAEEATLDNPIPVDQPYEVGGERLMYPGDSSLGASPGNVINCQCISVSAIKTGEDAHIATYEIAGLGEVKFPKRARLCEPQNTK